MQNMQDPRVFLAQGEANELIQRLPAGSVRLVSTSPRYLDLIDYTAGDEGWRPRVRESVLDYADEHLEACRQFFRVLADDAVVAVEIDDYRVPRESRLVLLSDLWAEMLEAAGFRIAEKITLARTLAIGHRSGHFKRYKGKAGYFLPDNVTSELIVAFKGDPLARIRRDATDDMRIDMAWAERFLRNLWMVAPPDARRDRSHPVPQDSEVARSIVSFYSLPGDCVLDPYAGSGTTGRVARDLGRNAILFERVERFALRMREEIGALPLENLGRRVMVPSSQLWLELGAVAEANFRREFRERTTLAQISPRLREIATYMSEATGVRIPPELVAIAMRAERSRLQDMRAA